MILASLGIPVAHLAQYGTTGTIARHYGMTYDEVIRGFQSHLFFFFPILTSLDLSSGQPTVKVLFLTPEKIANSPQTLGILTNLYRKDMLSRFVIDEAHCVSTWGHDFRKDYKVTKLLILFLPH